jgi:hypothetical protein
MASYRPIGHDAVVGDCRDTAPVPSEGSVDWPCFPASTPRALLRATQRAAALRLYSRRGRARGYGVSHTTTAGQTP